ncbi:MAG: precorrin-6Y C5,15-methyltransferase (decarboxylating) subunit CbiT, partial [Lachnospiraceae bacterium]|nr:precorrin-6Y C5,15-methyltransferase (decarboxylating) subunit CbiT [Lachnospiraceae bacterium]
YDIGSGTGSIAVEIASLSPDITVYAIERKPEAVELIKQNAAKFGLKNIKVVEGYAPEALKDLPAPTHAFIGGSGGNMNEIVETLLEKNPCIRVCANAVSLETLEELKALETAFEVEDFRLVQLAAVRTGKVGSYTMMKAENPVWICTFNGKTVGR